MPPKKQHTAPAGVARLEAPAIPLHCLLCPKRPSFSDVSHLLTHISSKSHLSNRFKIEIRSQKERDAQQTLREFDVWYESYGIGELLSDRMATKDKKKGPVLKRGRAQSPVPKPRGTYSKRGALIKPDPDHIPRRSINGSLHAHGTRQDYSLEPSPYHTPISGHSRHLYPESETPDRQPKSEPWDPELDGESGLLEEYITELAVDEDPDRAKLKGIYWPGMSLFDSATEDQKRKRNQRKDAAVVRNMEQVAAGVEPTECIWTEDIDLQRTRDIYATPSICGSPEPDPEQEAEPKKKRARRSTATTKTTQTRQRRTSGRVARAKKAPKRINADSSANVDDDKDGEDDTAPIDDLGTKVEASSSSRSPDDGYDIFRDAPPASDGHPDKALNGIKFEPVTRPPLQQMSTNIGIPSPSADSFKHLPHLRRGESAPGLGHSPHSPVAGSLYPHHPTLGHGTFNPLYLSGRPQYTYNPFSNQGYGEEIRPTQGSSFQPINAMHGLPPYSSYTLPNGGQFYTGAPAHGDTPDFDI